MKKLSMEIMYVPQATNAQKKEMILEWRTESENTFRFSMISAAVSFFALAFFYAGSVDFFYIYAASSVISLLSGYMAKKWSMVGYVGVFLSAILNCIWFSIGLPDSYVYIGSIILVAVCGFIPCFFAARCAFNYGTVFVPLRESKGFPDFIMSTADLYGDKIYLKDKPDENIYDNKYDASYNPFKTDKDISDEEFRRSQELKSSGLNETITMNIGDEGETEKSNPGEILEEKPTKTYKYGKKLGDFEIVFLHDDLEDMSFQEKALLMSKWRGNIARAEKNFYIFFVLVAISCMAGGFGDFAGSLVRYFVLVLFALGISRMKIGYTSGALITLGAVVYSFCIVNSAISMFLVIAAYVVNFGIIVAPIIFLINKRLYNELSEMEGFPTFIRTTADLYGSQMYILDEKPPIVKKTNKDHFITMNIGYDEEPKKPEEDKAWNAFDYMDEEKKENDQCN